MQATFGIPIFNQANNVKNLIFALRATTPAAATEIIVFDDCSPDPHVSEAVRRFCQLQGIRYLRGDENRGVPAAWNRLTAAAAAEVVFLLNDDVRPTSPDWFDAVVSVFELNPRVGIAYWCQQRVDPHAGHLGNLTADSRFFAETQARHPLLRSNFCGAFFAIRKSLWASICQPDGSIGFWEDLRAYGEEIDMSSACHRAGYLIVQLSPIWEHLASQTFRANPSRRERKELSPFLSAAEFRRLTRPAEPPEGTNLLRRMHRQARDLLAPRAPTIPKLDYSVGMVRKKWRNERILGFTSEHYFQRLFADGFPESLREAARKGHVVLPEAVRYRYQGTEFVATQSELLADRSANLT